MDFNEFHIVAFFIMAVINSVVANFLFELIGCCEWWLLGMVWLLTLIVVTLILISDALREIIVLEI